MEDIKGWYKSRTVWGSLVTIGATGAGLAGVVLSSQSQTQLIDALVFAATGIGGLVSLIYRIKADKKLG